MLQNEVVTEGATDEEYVAGRSGGMCLYCEKPVLNACRPQESQSQQTASLT